MNLIIAPQSVKLGPQQQDDTVSPLATIGGPQVMALHAGLMSPTSTAPSSAGGSISKPAEMGVQWVVGGSSPSSRMNRVIMTQQGSPPINGQTSQTENQTSPRSRESSGLIKPDLFETEDIDSWFKTLQKVRSCPLGRRAPPVSRNQFLP